MCIHIHTHIQMHFYTFLYTCKYGNKPHPNIFTSKLIATLSNGKYK